MKNKGYCIDKKPAKFNGGIRGSPGKRGKGQKNGNQRCEGRGKYPGARETGKIHRKEGGEGKEREEDHPETMQYREEARRNRETREARVGKSRRGGIRGHRQPRENKQGR
ncbi:hypothetical protein KIL84_019701 [Mauremys mutica]|uniref:Uncharacterized protein n=1 Tax=Mauremys mutica TaxID=74926 RepID=A0A9D3XVS3_9SAUR|nr:hypothetical protein KIL84_019701 [Mauremys mutica]